MAWKKEPFPAGAVNHPHIQEFVEILTSLYVNGGVVLRSFHMTSRLDLATHGINRALQEFLTSPSVVAALPELQIELPLREPPEFHERSAFGMEGDLTSMLLEGGAYRNFSGTVEQARFLSRRFMEALFGDDFQKSIWVAHSETQWTAWFPFVAWSNTFVVQDSRHSRLVLLCASDTD